MEDVAKAVGGEITFIPRRKFEVGTSCRYDKNRKLLGWKYKTEILDWVKNFSSKVNDQKKIAECVRALVKKKF